MLATVCRAGYLLLLDLETTLELALKLKICFVIFLRAHFLALETQPVSNLYFKPKKTPLNKTKMFYHK